MQNELPTTEKGKGASAVAAGPKENLEEEGKGSMIGDRDTGVTGETGFVGFKDTHHHRQQQEQLGGGCARVSHQEDLVCYLQINLGEGRGLLFVPVSTLTE